MLGERKRLPDACERQDLGHVRRELAAFYQFPQECQFSCVGFALHPSHGDADKVLGAN